jgi:hypothetical protein
LKNQCRSHGITSIPSKWDLQAVVVEVFKDLVESGRDESFVANHTWFKVNEMQDAYIHHKGTLNQ